MTKKKNRNPFAVHARRRKGGPMRNKGKRGKGRGKGKWSRHPKHKGKARFNPRRKPYEGLYMVESGDGTMYALYDAYALEILGWIQLSFSARDHDAYVSHAVAKRGWGPLMYDWLATELFFEHGMFLRPTSDQTDHARRLWSRNKGEEGAWDFMTVQQFERVYGVPHGVMDGKYVFDEDEVDEIMDEGDDLFFVRYRREEPVVEARPNRTTTRSPGTRRIAAIRPGRRARLKKVRAARGRARAKSWPTIPGVHPLLTLRDFRREGHEMDHCVGYFFDLDSQIFAFESPSGKRATLEITRHPDGEYTVHQFMGPRNRAPGPELQVMLDKFLAGLPGPVHR